MARAMYAVRDNTLVRVGSTARVGAGVAVGSPAWLEWLQAHETSSFRFEYGAQGFTARRERRRGGVYWYAYRKRAGLLRKAYLGCSSELDLARLTTVATALARRHAAAEARPHPRRSPPAAVEIRRDNLPAQPTSFVGREQALADLTDLLRSTRLLVLAGSGGVGKTRLALQIAASSADEYMDGVWLVDLAPLNDPDLVPHQVAATLSVREQAERDVTATVAEALRSSQLLLVLDNCEHVIGACAALVDRLLRVCPSIRVLATSREVLGIDGETIWRVPPLSVPDATPSSSAPIQSESVRLFVERASGALGRFGLSLQNAAAVARICSRLDGIPLALELAAGRLRTLSVEDIAARLDDRFELLNVGSRTAQARHQTLRALVDWSYELLTAPERILFARLSVFVGGWTLPAAETVCAGAKLSSKDVMNLLARLVDKSLVVLEPPGGSEGRYHLLETLRQYASEKLGSGRSAKECAKRHAAYFLNLAEIIEPRADTTQGESWRVTLEQEHDNLRAALRWLIDAGQVESAQRLGAALEPLWRLHVAEGWTRARELLALPQQNAPASTRAKLCVSSGTLLMFTGDYAAAEPLMQEGLRLSRAAADLPMVAHTLSVLSNLIWLRREFAAARDLAEEGVEASRRAGDRREEALNLWVLAQATHDLGDDDDACRLAEAALAISSEIDFAPAAALALTTLGQLQFRRAELVPARRLLERSLQENRAANRPLAWQWALGNLGWVVLEQGDFGEARALFLDALAIGRDVLGGRARLAIPLEGLAQVAAATGDPERAYLLAGAAWTLRETYATPPAPTEQWQLERSLQRARAAMGERAAADAWASGRALNAEQAIAEALATPATATSQSGVAGHASDALTPREREVAALIGQGLSTHELAEHLVIAEATARVHIEHILAKLGLHSRTQLAIWAFTTRG